MSELTDQRGLALAPLLPGLVLDHPDVTWRTGDMSDRCVAELKGSWRTPA